MPTSQTKNPLLSLVRKPENKEFQALRARRLQIMVIDQNRQAEGDEAARRAGRA